MSMPIYDIIRFRIRRANQSLGDADALARLGSWNGTVNRLYFACFYSVAALAAWDSISTTEPGDMRRSVDQYDIRSGRIRHDLGDFYEELSALRLDGDYKDFVVFDEQKVRPLITEARRFVASIESLLSEGIEVISVKLIGIDQCKDGWIVVTSDESLRTLIFTISLSFKSIIQMADTDDMRVVIDTPIGLSEDGSRACDIAARRVLGSPRRSSVFPAPCRATLQATTYEEASDLNFLASGKSVSKQLFAILPRIREVDMAMTPERQKVVREAHPDVIFATLADTGFGLIHSKKTAAGERERIALLAKYIPHFDPMAVRARIGPAKVARDDIIDAVACLVTASRIASGQAQVLPSGNIPRDACGLRMEMVA